MKEYKRSKNCDKKRKKEQVIAIILTDPTFQNSGRITVVQLRWSVEQLTAPNGSFLRGSKKLTRNLD